MNVSRIAVAVGLVGLATLVAVPSAQAASITITVGSDSCTFTNNVSSTCTIGSTVSLSGDSLLLSSTLVQASGFIDGWDITDSGLNALGTTHSPSTSPLALDLQVTATCQNASGCAELDIFFTDSGFTTTLPAGSLSNVLSGHTAPSNDGTVTQTAWVGTPTSVVGTALPTVGFGGTSFGGPAVGPSPYSLTIEQTFTRFANGTFVSTDGSITGVAPEPGSLLLLGTGLAGLAGAIRKRVGRGTRA